ncbi:hypothetical protein Tco_0278193 [Tanacetum coccineum]
MTSYIGECRCRTHGSRGESSILGYRYYRLLSLLGTLTFFPDVPCSASYSFCLVTGYTSRGAVGAWPFWILSGVGLGPIAYCMARAYGLIDIIRAQIIATVHLSLFSPFNERCGQLEFPDRNAVIKDSPEGKIGMYSRFIEFANYRIPLSKILLCVLEYYQINLSQLSVIGAAKDPLLVDEAVDLLCMELLNENRTLIRIYLETFLCLVGLSRSFTKTGLLDFVNSTDPFKVKTGEWTLAENEVPLLTQTEDRVISPSLQTISLVNHTIQDELNVNASKRKKKNKQVDAVSGSVVPTTEDATFSSVTPTLERALEDVLHDNVVLLVSSSQAGASVPVPEPADDSCPLTAPEPETGDKDAEVSKLKTKLEKLEFEAAGVEELHKRVSDLEVMVVVKIGEAASLTTHNDGLLEKDATERHFVERAAELDARIAQIEAYDLKVEGKYVAAVSEFKGVSFPLLDELESLKDSPLALIMSALILKNDQGNTYATPEFAWFQPSLNQVIMPTYSESGFVDREMLLSDAIPAIRQSAERRGLCPPLSSAVGLLAPFILMTLLEVLRITRSLLWSCPVMKGLPTHLFELILTMVPRVASYHVKLF